MRRLDLDAAKTKLKRARSEQGRQDVSKSPSDIKLSDMYVY